MPIGGGKQRDQERTWDLSFTATAALIVLGISITLASCTKPRAKTWEYSCPDGYAFTITYSDPENMGDIAFLVDASGTTKLPRTVAASGAKYSNGAVTFWGQGEEAMIMVSGEIEHQNCRVD